MRCAHVRIADEGDALQNSDGADDEREVGRDPERVVERDLHRHAAPVSRAKWAQSMQSMLIELGFSPCSVRAIVSAETVVHVLCVDKTLRAGEGSARISRMRALETNASHNKCGNNSFTI